MPSSSDAPSKVSSTIRPKLSGRKRLLFRLIALVIGLSPLLILELALRTVDWPPHREQQDPYIGFQATRNLFQHQPELGEYVIDEARSEFFRPDSFRDEKGDDEFRIFCLGGSTVQGRPYQIETSFTTWLELSLKASQPDVDWQVVNCGGVSYASYRLVLILEEVLDYEPDLIILYTGHNEFLEDRTYASYRDQAAPLRTAHRWSSELKLYQAIRQFAAPIFRPRGGGAKELLSAEVEARLDFENGLQAYHRDDRWRAAVVHHFGINLRRMVSLCRQDNIPLICVDPVENWRSCGPFKSELSEEMPRNDRQRFDELWFALNETASSLKDDRIELLVELTRIAPRHAESHFQLAVCYDQQEEYEQARVHYALAIEEDVCPLRMLESMHQELASLTEQAEIPLVPARKKFRQLSAHGLVGEDWLVDHVHPSIDGHKMIAAWLLETMESEGYVSPEPNWQARRDELFAEHFAQLEFAYFEHGRQRLEGLKRWTEGRAFGALSQDQKTPIQQAFE